MFMVVFCTLMAFSFAVDRYPSDCVLPFPRSYVVYHWNEQEGIHVDGKLDEEAWDSVSWTEDFIGKFEGNSLSSNFHTQSIYYPSYICKIAKEGTQHINRATIVEKNLGRIPKFYFDSTFLPSPVSMLSFKSESLRVYELWGIQHRTGGQGEGEPTNKGLNIRK